MSPFFDPETDFDSSYDAQLMGDPVQVPTFDEWNDLFNDFELDMSYDAPVLSPTSSSTSSTKSSVPPETPVSDLLALPHVEAGPQLALPSGPVYIEAIDVNLLQPKVEPYQTPLSLQAAAMLQMQSVQYAQAVKDLQSLAMHYGRYGIHFPAIQPVLMQLVPKNTVPTHPSGTDHAPTSTASASKSTAQSRTTTPSRTKAKEARASHAPYQKPAAPFDLKQSLQDAEYFRKIRVAKERRARDEGRARAQGVHIPSVLLPPPPK